MAKLETEGRPDYKNVEVIDTKTQTVIGDVNLTSAIADFCESVYFYDPQCEEADMNGDGIIDY